MDIFHIENLNFTYPLLEQKALQDVSFTVKKGEFLTIFGPSGCGKTTLISHLKPSLTPHGSKDGTILFNGIPIDSLDMRTEAAKIGYIFQHPDEQIVTDKVWHEIAFGLENLGKPQDYIRRSVSEMASYLDIGHLFHRNVSSLSGGEKQLLNLASVLAMHPDVIILDEPTSQLDPIHATQFLDVIAKLNRDLGITIIMIDHRLEDILPMSDRALLLEDGKIGCLSSPKDVCLHLANTKHSLLKSVPSGIQIFAEINPEHMPLTTGKARLQLEEVFCNPHPQAVTFPSPNKHEDTHIVLKAKNLSFRYQKHGADILKHLTMQIPRGSFYTILGANGAGKSTLLSLIAKVNKPYTGKLTVHGSVATLPQNPQSLFLKQTVWDDLHTVCQDDEKIRTLAQKTNIETIFEHHPYDISGGQMQLVALTKVLLTDPEILLLDEPTKGLDAESKLRLANILKSLIEQGVTVIVVSHDVEFCAQHAQMCAMMFDGSLISEADTRSFFSSNYVYTTSANKIARTIQPNAITVEDVLTLWNNYQQNAETLSY